MTKFKATRWLVIYLDESFSLFGSKYAAEKYQLDHGGRVARVEINEVE